MQHLDYTTLASFSLATITLLACVFMKQLQVHYTTLFFFMSTTICNNLLLLIYLYWLEDFFKPLGLKESFHLLFHLEIIISKYFSKYKETSTISTGVNYFFSTNNCITYDLTGARARTCTSMKISFSYECLRNTRRYSFLLQIYYSCTTAV